MFFQYFLHGARCRRGHRLCKDHAAQRAVHNLRAVRANDRAGKPVSLKNQGNIGREATRRSRDDHALFLRFKERRNIIRRNPARVVEQRSVHIHRDHANISHA